jgi:MOSC domain-containing protein
MIGMAGSSPRERSLASCDFTRRSASTESLWWTDCDPLLVCTDGAVSMFGRDVRRLRPNLMVGGVEGMAERTWPGAILRLPEAEIGLADLRSRCVMTTCDPETAEQDPGVLRDIVRRFGGQLCLNAAVTRAGRVEVGHSIELIAP